MNPAAALFRRPAMVGVLMTAACTIEPRDIQVADGSAGAGGQGGTSVVRDASEEASDARAGSDGAGGMRRHGRSQRCFDRRQRGQGWFERRRGHRRRGGRDWIGGRRQGAGASGGIGGRRAVPRASLVSASAALQVLAAPELAERAVPPVDRAESTRGRLAALRGQTGSDASDVRIVDIYRVDAPDGGDLSSCSRRTSNPGPLANSRSYEDAKRRRSG